MREVNLLHLVIGIHAFPITMYLLYRLYRGASLVTMQRAGFTPKLAFATCHDMLERIVVGAYGLLPDLPTMQPTAWERFSVSADGILYAGENRPGAALVPITQWDAVSGVGLEMRPVYKYAPATRSFWDVATRINTGYQFNIVVVPRVGNTLDITLPLRNNQDALDFAAHLLAFARARECRLSLMGFDKALTRGVVHLDMF